MSKRSCRQANGFTETADNVIGHVGDFLSILDLAKLPCVSGHWRNARFAVTELALDLFHDSSEKHIRVLVPEDGDDDQDPGILDRLLQRGVARLNEGIARLVDLSAVKSLFVQTTDAPSQIEVTLLVAQYVLDHGKVKTLELYLDHARETTGKLFHYNYNLPRLDLARIGSIKALKVPFNTVCFIKSWPTEARCIKNSLLPFALLPMHDLEALGDERLTAKISEPTEMEETRLAALREVVCDFAAMDSYENAHFWVKSFWCTDRMDLVVAKLLDRLQWCKNLKRCDLSLDLQTMNTGHPILQTMVRNVPQPRIRINGVSLDSVLRELPNIGEVSVVSKRTWFDAIEHVTWGANLRTLARRPDCSSLHFNLTLLIDSEVEALYYGAAPDPPSWTFLRHLVLRQTPWFFLTAFLLNLPSLETLIVLVSKRGDQLDANAADVAGIATRKSHLVAPNLTKAVLPCSAKYEPFIESMHSPKLQELWLLGEVVTSTAVLPPSVTRASVYTEFYHLQSERDHQRSLTAFKDANSQLPLANFAFKMQVPRPGRVKNAWSLTGLQLFDSEKTLEKARLQPIDPLFAEAVAIFHEC